MLYSHYVYVTHSTTRAHRDERQRPALPFFQYGFSKQELTRLWRKAGFYVEYVQPLYAHRLLQEELPGYNWLSKRVSFVRTLAERLLLKREGHMVLMIGQKPSPKRSSHIAPGV